MVREMPFQTQNSVLLYLHLHLVLVTRARMSDLGLLVFLGVQE